MVDTGGGEQERLPGGIKVSREAGKDRLAQSLGARRPARLARPDDGKPERGQTLLETLGLNRVQFVTDSLNTRSQAAIAKLGATREGVLRSHAITRGGRIRHTVELKDTPAVRGMIHKVRHLVTVE